MNHSKPTLVESEKFDEAVPIIFPLVISQSLDLIGASLANGED